MRVICTSKGMSKKFGVRVVYRKIQYIRDLTLTMLKYLAQRRHSGRPVSSTEPVWVYMKTNISISGQVTPQNSLATPRSFPSTAAILPQPTKWSFNSNKSPTRFNNFPVYYPDVYLQLNMFRAFSRPSSRAQWLKWQPLVLPSYRGDSRAVFVVGPDHEHSTTITTLRR
jgi:hypothetical protein